MFVEDGACGMVHHCRVVAHGLHQYDILAIVARGVGRGYETLKVQISSLSVAVATFSMFLHHVSLQRQLHLLADDGAASRELYLTDVFLRIFAQGKAERAWRQQLLLHLEIVKAVLGTFNFYLESVGLGAVDAYLYLIYRNGHGGKICFTGLQLILQKRFRSTCCRK